MDRVDAECLNARLNVVSTVKRLVKTITIRDDAYKKLVAVKEENESFSELFERLTEGGDTLGVLVRLRGAVEFERKERMLSELHASRAERRH